jgi:hypothetical protein
LEKYPELVSCTHAYLDHDTLLGQSYKIDAEGQQTFESPSDVQSVKRIFLFPTLLYRNRISRNILPNEWFTCQNRDQILTSFLGNFGGNLHMPELIGSVYNRNPFSTWHPLSDEKKTLERYRTRYAILQMNLRIQNEKAVDFCKKQVALMKLSMEQKLEVMDTFKTQLKLSQNYKAEDLEFASL